MTRSTLFAIAAAWGLMGAVAASYWVAVQHPHVTQR